MGYYLGKFYFEKKDFFLILAILSLLGTIHFSYPLPLFDSKNLLVLTILFLLAKGVVLPTHDTAVFTAFLVALFLTLFFPLFKVLIFLVFAFIFLRLTKVV